MKDDQPRNDENVIHLDWQNLPPSDPVERVARALCRYAGHDPDVKIPVERLEPVIAEEGVAFERATEEPAWKAYAAEAGRLVTAFEAFSRS